MSPDLLIKLENFTVCVPIHMNGRIYDPKLGRFLQADPFVQAPKDSQSLNRYTYVGSDKNLSHFSFGGGSGPRLSG